MKTVVKKPGMEIELEIGGIDKYGYIVFSYQFSISDKRKIGKTYKDGKFLFNAPETIKGAKFGGFSVEGEQRIEIENYIEKIKKEKEEERKKILSDLVSGERLLTVSVVGCDCPHYQAWIDGIDEKRFSAQELMEEAIKIILKNEGVEVFLGSSIEFLQEIHGKNIFCKNEAPSFAINPRSEKESLDYHGFGEAVVTSYDVRLIDLMNIYIEKKLKKEVKKEVKEEVKEVKIIKKIKNGDDFGAIVEVEKKMFRVMNIFDYGLVCVEIDDTGKKIETEEGKKLSEYLLKNPPIYGVMRM